MEDNDFYDFDEPECETCGGCTFWEDCYNCGGEGFFDGQDLMEEDPLWYGPEDTETCDTCKGKGGWHVCHDYKTCGKEPQSVALPKQGN